MMKIYSILKHKRCCDSDNVVDDSLSEYWFKSLLIDNLDFYLIDRHSYDTVVNHLL